MHLCNGAPREKDADYNNFVVLHIECDRSYRRIPVSISLLGLCLIIQNQLFCNPILILLFLCLPRFSSLIAFKNVLKEVADLAGQREVVAENLQNQVLQGILLLAKNLREERKKALNQGATLTQSLHTQIGTLDRAKRSYEKAFREAEKAIESYHKADADFHLSRADVEKQRVNMNIRNSQSEDAKSEYANQLQITNKQQQQHYQIALPEVNSNRPLGCVCVCVCIRHALL